MKGETTPSPSGSTATKAARSLRTVRPKFTFRLPMPVDADSMLIHIRHPDCGGPCCGATNARMLVSPAWVRTVAGLKLCHVCLARCGSLDNETAPQV